MSFSSDQPRRDPRRRMGKLKARLTAHLYQVDYGRGSEWAYYPGDDLLTLGTDRTTVFDPASEQWWIRPFGGYHLIVALGSSVGVSDPQLYKTFAVTASGLGTPVDGPAVAQYAATMDIAPNGAFMVAAIDTSTIGLFLWTGATFSSTPVETVTVAQATRISISPDSATVALALNGTPYIQAFPVSAAGFGAAYANPATLPVGGALHGGIDWHPSGTAVAHGVSQTGLGVMTLGVWAFSGGWGSKYADPASSYTDGATSSVRFAPDGASLFVARRFPGDSADGQFRVYEFDLVSGIGARIAASASPIAGPIDWSQADYNGSLIALGSQSQWGFITYTFDGAAIGPGTTYYWSTPDDEFDFAWHLKFSPDGKYLAATAPHGGTVAPFNAGRVTVFSVAADGTLAQVGTTYIDLADGDWPYVMWRQT